MRCASLALLLAAFTGCAFSAVKRPFVAPITKAANYAASPEQALEAAKTALQAMGYEVQLASPELGLVRSKPRAVVIPETCDCGTWNMSPVTGTAASTVMIGIVKRGDNLTSVSVKHQCFADFAGQNLYGATTRREGYECASRGGPEAQVFKFLDRLLGEHVGPVGTIQW